MQVAGVCKGKAEQAIHECLEKHERHGAANDGFSSACYEAHEAFEKSSGKGGSEEAEHHEEGTEKKE